MGNAKRSSLVSILILSVLGRAVCAVVVCLSLVSAASADTFSAGANQFSIDFVGISGDTNPASGYGIVNNDYRMGTFEVTNDQWTKFQAAYGTVTGNPSTAYDAIPTWTSTNVPHNNTSWYEAAQFVNWLNTSTGHQAAYKFTGTQGTGDYTLATWSAAEADNGTNLYRHKDAFYFLPTEDEWVKAAYWNGTALQTYATKAGESLTQGDGTSGTGWNYYDGGYTDPYGPWDVGSGSEELNGTHDMMGNVWEWMESAWTSGDYETASSRGLRGGSYDGLDGAGNLVSSNRDRIYPYDEYFNVGFRVTSEVPGPVIRISADTVDTSFDPSGGAFGLGTLLFEQDTPIEIDYDNDGLTEVFEDGSIQIWTDLFDDTSSGDLASGYFEGGEFAIFDDDDNILLSGNVQWFRIFEVVDGAGYMSGDGLLSVTSGELMDRFGPMGEMFDVTFRLDPRDIDDFSTAFTGESDLTIIPAVPEPSTLLLLAPALLGMVGVALRRWKQCGITVLVIVAFLAIVQPATALQVYFNNFAGTVGPEWSHTTIGPPLPTEGGFLGKFGGNEARDDFTVTLTLDGLPTYTDVSISFKLFVLGSWDGNGGTDPWVMGPDIWDLSIEGGPTLLHTTFSNVSYFDQAYPGTYPGGSFPPRTGAASGGGREVVYQLNFTAPHSGNSLTFNFTGIGLQPVADESWGLDNVQVAITLAPPIADFTFDIDDPLDTVLLPGQSIYFTDLSQNMGTEEDEWLWEILDATDHSAVVASSTLQNPEFTWTDLAYFFADFGAEHWYDVRLTATNSETSDSITREFQFMSIPEPSTLLLLAPALFGIAGVVLKRRR